MAKERTFCQQGTMRNVILLFKTEQNTDGLQLTLLDKLA